MPRKISTTGSESICEDCIYNKKEDILKKDEVIINFGEFSKICRNRDNTTVNGCNKYTDGCDEKCTYWQSLRLKVGDK